MPSSRLVSIIVPVHNAQDFLNKSIGSVLSQSYKSIEVVIVDDGSTDDSLSVCLELAKSDNRIRVISQKNSGVSSARNTGLEKATGAYVTFLDPDDFLFPGAISKSVDLLETHDVNVVRTSYKINKLDEEFASAEKLETGLYDHNKLNQLAHSALVGDFSCYVWLLMIKKDYIDSAGLKFPVGISMMEDTWFYADMLKTVEAIYVSDTITYSYRLNEGGASRSIEGFSEKINSIIKVNKHVVSESINPKRDAQINAVHAKSIASMVMVRADKAGIDTIKEMLNAVSEDRAVLNVYHNADMKTLNTYNRFATYAVIKNNLAAVLLLKLLRKIGGK